MVTCCAVVTGTWFCPAWVNVLDAAHILLCWSWGPSPYDEAVANLVQLMPMTNCLIAMVSLVVNDVWIMSMASDLVTNLKMDRCCT